MNIGRAAMMFIGMQQSGRGKAVLLYVSAVFYIIVYCWLEVDGLTDRKGYAILCNNNQNKQQESG